MALYMTMAFARVMQGGMDVVQSEVARMARGDLSGNNRPLGHDEVADTLLVLRDSLNRLAELFTVLRRGVSSVSHASGEISQASEDLATGIVQSGEVTQQLREGIHNTVALLDQHEQHVIQAVERARDVNGDAQRSRRAMGQLAEVMTLLQQRGLEIGKIVSMIDGIAFQTNLLRSTPRWKRPRPVWPARALAWWPAKCADWPSAWAMPPSRSMKW